MSDVEFPAEWEEIVAQLTSGNMKKVMVLGGPDQGKSTLCRYLIGRMEASGRSALLVDADVGQKDLGPPATIALGRPITPFSASPPVVHALSFVGAVSPTGHFLPAVVGTQEMVRQAGDSFVVVNTTGFIGGPGRGLKEAKIEAVKPDLLIAIQEGQEAEPLLRGFRGICRMIRLRRSPWVVTKTPERRRKARETGFRRYFEGARVLQLGMDQLAVQRGNLDVGSGRGRNRPGRLTGLLCGLCRGDRTVAGLGILQEMNIRARTISFLTPTAEDIALVQLGSIYLAPTGEELRNAEWRMRNAE